MQFTCEFVLYAVGFFHGKELLLNFELDLALNEKAVQSQSSYMLFGGGDLLLLALRMSLVRGILLGCQDEGPLQFG